MISCACFSGQIQSGNGNPPVLGSNAVRIFLCGKIGFNQSHLVGFVGRKEDRTKRGSKESRSYDPTGQKQKLTSYTFKCLYVHLTNKSGIPKLIFHSVVVCPIAMRINVRPEEQCNAAKCNRSISPEKSDSLRNRGLRPRERPSIKEHVSD